MRDTEDYEEAGVIPAGVLENLAQQMNASPAPAQLLVPEGGPESYVTGEQLEHAIAEGWWNDKDASRNLWLNAVCNVSGMSFDDAVKKLAVYGVGVRE